MKKLFVTFAVVCMLAISAMAHAVENWHFVTVQGVGYNGFDLNGSYVAMSDGSFPTKWFSVVAGPGANEILATALTASSLGPSNKCWARIDPDLTNGPIKALVMMTQ
jgi:hypothetical protein